MGSTYWPEFCGDRGEYDAFWSYQLTVNTSNPDFTLCFQRTVLTWPPAVLLLLGTPLHLMDISDMRRRRGWLDFSKLDLLKTISCFIMTLMSMLMIVWVPRPSVAGDPYVTPADYVATSARFLSLILVLFHMRWDFMKGVVSSALLCLYFLLLLLCEIFQCRSNAMRQGQDDLAQDQKYFIVYMIYFAFLSLEFLLTFFPNNPSQVSGLDDEKLHLVDNDKLQESISKDSEERSTAKRCPVESASFWSRITFLWLSWDIFRAYRHTLTFGSLYRLRLEDRCKTLLKKYYRKFFITETPNTATDKTPGSTPHRPLWVVIFHCVKRDFLTAILLRLVAIPVSFINPQLLNLFITFVGSNDDNMWKGIILAIGMYLVNNFFSLLINNFLVRAFIAGTKARSVVNAIVYRKALRLSSTARKQTTVGQVVNLMSVDAQKVQDLYIYSSLLWSVPVMIALSVTFLWQTIGPSCLAGLAVLLTLIPINAGYFARKAYGFQREQMVHKDKRFRVMNEILAGMKVLKLYAWEPSFEKKILDYRNEELRTIKNVNYINAFGSMCWLLSPYLVSLAIFATYILVDPNNVLTANKAFVTLSLINLLNFPLSILPLGVANTTQGIVSLKRIEKFLELDEIDTDSTKKDTTLRENRVIIDNASFSWGRNEPIVLHDIKLKVPTGGLIAIVGAVGSGKSSLISAILGEMFTRSGDIRYNGSIAYVPQQAWIVHNSLKENITFGKTLNDKKYHKIIRACALERDLTILPGGDETEIGEKGINLSGGQKQRVSLARAVYQDEELYLLDDPLSAVDANVGKQIFDQVIGPNGVLRKKTRVFVTHGIPYLPQCDKIIVLKDGKIADEGTYDQLLEEDGPFADVIRSYLEGQDSDESDEENDDLRQRIYRLSETSDAASLAYSSEGEGSGRKRSARSRRSRSNSRTSRRSVTKEPETKAVKLVEEEKEQEGSISLAVLKSYVKAGGYLMLNFVVWSHVFYIVFQILTNIWLSQWTSDMPVNGTYDRGLSLYRLSVYGYFGIGQMLCALAEAFAVAHGCYCASRTLHERVLNRILHAPMAFFDTTPLGRIMNRFSKDLDVLDANLPLFIRQWLFSVSPVIVTIVVICYSTPIFAAVFVPLAVLYVVLQRLYVTAARQLKRIDAVRRSPIYIHFDESVVGSASIRAYGREQQFIDTCDRLIDESQRPWFLVIVAYRWCGIVMEAVGNLVVFFASLFAVLQRGSISPGLAGLSVSYALQVTVYMNAVIRNSSELETYVVSVERLAEYMEIDTEAEWQVNEKRPPAEWPALGTIQFSNYCTRYRPGLDLVLKNIDCFIKAGEKVGIVGRTGAGKSSLSLALFRIIESAGGGIYIDGRQISDMGLHDLRKKISIIPQDPVVFSGSLRSNLDPFSVYTDDEIWEALEHSHLKPFVMETAEGLQYECGENGEALSVGLRQLLCLARALLRKSKILVLDEATAAIDYETDTLIQMTIRQQFKHCTILTVAHRLHTVLDYERIMVLDQGRVAELDSPTKLMDDKTTIFYGMAKDAGLT